MKGDEFMGSAPLPLRTIWLMNSDMLLARVDDEVLIVDGKLIVPEATRSLLGQVMAPIR